MRTNIVLDDELVEEALDVSGLKTKKDVIHAALTLLVQYYRRKDLREIKGSIKFAPGYDFRKSRERAR